ncbi:protein kinase [Streptomyces sp. NPDC051105]|uniref:protein kinase domain-containing protein n=1 Tax=Streptomyces sp. NPDC051105 TaxID=3154843 RepID=UPI003449E48D
MGEVFAGRYELADPIGHGGVGAVWRAWDHRRKRYVAAKVLQQSDAHALLRFVREQALRIDHPHVLAPASWAADDDKVLFTMDLVAGGSLVHLVGDYGPLPPVFVCTLLEQLLSGLAAVHAEGVVHRDIKPANILLEASGTARPRLRLSDFGIAMRFGEARLTETNLVVGTPGYIAPEQLLGADPDFTADLFAVGLVALFLLEGAKPDAKALVQHFAEHGTPGAPKGIPDPLWQVVATLLQPNPQSRFRTATGARKALAQAMELLPEPGIDDESIEIFDQLGPLPPGFGPEGPLRVASGVDTTRHTTGTTGTAGTAGTGTRAGSTTEAAAGSGVASGTAAGAEADADPASLTGTSTGWDTTADRGRPSEASTPTGYDTTPESASGTTPEAGFDTTPGAGFGTAPEAASRTAPKPASDRAPEAASGTPTGTDPGSAAGAQAGTAYAPPATSTGPAGSPSAAVGMSDTGSFRLPPPQTPVPPAPYAEPPQPTPPYPPHAAHQEPQSWPGPDPRPGTESEPQPRPQPRPQQPPASSVPQPHTPWPPAQPLPPARPHTDPTETTDTATYTARDPQPASRVSQLPVRTHGRRRRRVPRPGPPAKAAVPILLLALACYVVGFWALTRI